MRRMCPGIYTRSEQDQYGVWDCLTFTPSPTGRTSAWTERSEVREMVLYWKGVQEDTLVCSMIGLESGTIC